MAVFAAMGEREAGGIGEAARAAVDDLRDEREGEESARADARGLQEIDEVDRAAFVGGGDGDLLVMGGTCQRTYQHCVPKVARADPRIAIMFRPVWESPR
jgi:hypothetical protein